MKKSSIIIRIEGGKLQDRKKMVQLLSAPDGRYLVELSSLNKRSNQQNAYIHAVLFPEFKNALQGVGYNIKSGEQGKEVCKKMFLTDRVVNEKTGEVLEYTKHTAELTKEEMGIFIEDVIRFAAEEMNYQIPYPNEALTLNFLQPLQK